MKQDSVTPIQVDIPGRKCLPPGLSLTKKIFGSNIEYEVRVLSYFLMVYCKERYVFLGERKGWNLRGGSSVKQSTKREEPYLFVSYSRGESHIFCGIFLTRIFLMLLSIFLFTFFDLIW